MQYLLGEEYAGRTNIRFSKAEKTKNADGVGGHARKLRDGVPHPWYRIYANTQDGFGDAFLVGYMEWLGMVENPLGWRSDLFQHYVIE